MSTDKITSEDLTSCSLCRKGILFDKNKSKGPLFYRVTVEQFVADIPAIQRALGFEMMMQGNAALVRTLGPNESLATRMEPPEPMLVCAPCMMDNLARLFNRD
jgi:hypothetical protein